jgi:2-keto-4-pentenoate hydratase/2-oxohepta-3-ene-1,7-dioic acid hydratase in catechol pathway
VVTNSVVPGTVSADARIFCIGRNYAEHAAELANPLPAAPVIFMKPPSSLVRAGQPIHFPHHGQELHHEVELVVKIGRAGRVGALDQALSYVAGISLGLDLTLRDLQQQLKQKGLPWEVAKAFDQSAPIGEFVACDASIDLGDIAFRCSVNGVQRQAGNSRDMIFPVARLLVELSRIWTLQPGDLLFTGTPAGVGPLRIGDRVEIASDLIGSFAWSIVA